MTDGYDKLRERLGELAVSLESIPVEYNANYALAKIFNALLAKVKDAHAEDFVVSEIPEATVNQFPNSEMSIGSMHAMVAQLQLVVG